MGVSSRGFYLFKIPSTLFNTASVCAADSVFAAPIGGIAGCGDGGPVIVDRKTHESEQSFWRVTP